MDFAQLERELLRVRALTDSWATRQVAEARDIKDQHATKLKEHSDKLRALRASQEQLQAAVDRLHKRLADEEHRTAALQTVASKLREEQNEESSKHQQLQESVHTQEMECLKREADVAVEESNRTSRLAALKRSLETYASRLGLEFRQVPEGELMLVMTQVDALDPLRPFKVAVRIQPDNTYKVTRCIPPVPKVAELTARLNETNQFSDFIVSLRREFQAYAADTQAQQH